MKCYRLFTGLLILWGLPVWLFSQNTDTLGFKAFVTPPKTPDRQNVIKGSPLPLLVGQIPICGELRVSYERVLARHHSLVIGGSYNFPGIVLLIGMAIDTTGRKISNYTIRGGRITAGYRFYPLKNSEAPEGFFIGPYFSYNFAKIKERNGSGNYESVHYLNASLIAGYQLVLDNGFTFEAFGGFGYKHNYLVRYYASSGRTTTEDFYSPLKILKNLKVVLQVNIGYAF